MKKICENKYVQYLYTAAHWYAEKGWIVKPSYGKKPRLTKGWQKWTDPAYALSQVEWQLRAYLDPASNYYPDDDFGHPERCGIGITCTSNGGVIVIDVDNKSEKELLEGNYDEYLKGNDGLPMRGRELLEWLKNRLDDLKDCPISRTPSGGFHIYYRCTSAELNDRKQIARITSPEGILLADVRCPGKGYLVESPTFATRRDDGSWDHSAGYFWIPRHVIGEYDSIPHVPDEFLSWLNEKEKPVVNRKNGNTNVQPTEIPTGAQFGVHNGQAWARLTYDDPRWPATYASAKYYINDLSRFPKTVGGRQYQFLRVLNALYWRFLLPVEDVYELAEDWARLAEYDDTRDKRERYNTASTTIPAGAVVGCGVVNQ